MEDFDKNFDEDCYEDSDYRAMQDALIWYRQEVRRLRAEVARLTTLAASAT